MQSGKVSINDVADYKPVFSGLQLSIVDYSTKTAEQLLIDTAKNTVEAEL
jgi:hypothetical protein